MFGRKSAGIIGFWFHDKCPNRRAGAASSGLRMCLDPKNKSQNTVSEGVWNFQEGTSDIYIYAVCYAFGSLGAQASINQPQEMILDTNVDWESGLIFGVNMSKSMNYPDQTCPNHPATGIQLASQFAMAAMVLPFV
jgi:hypothetical protein